MLPKYLTYIIYPLCLLIFCNFCFNQLPASFDGGEPSDFPNYYFAGKRWLENRPIYSDLKDEVSFQLGWQNYKAYPADPPAALFLVLPLSFLSFHNAAILLILISIFLVSVSIYFFSRQEKYSINSSLLFTCLALASSALLFQIKRCHMEAIVLFLGVFGLLLSKSHKKTTGVFWGLAAAIKLFPLLWIIPALFSKQKTIFYIGSITFIAVSIVSGAFIGLDNLQTFLFNTIPRSADWYGTIGNYSLISYFCALFERQYGVLIGWLAGCIVLVKLWLSLRADRENIERGFILSICAALLISPLSWLNYFILVFPLLIIIARDLDTSSLVQRAVFYFLLLIFWNWPTSVETPWLFLTVTLSCMPMFGLLTILFMPSLHNSKSK